MSAFANFGWGSLRHGGLLLDPQRVARIAEHKPDAIPAYLEQELRRQATRILEGSADGPEFVAFILQKICGFTSETGTWQRGHNVGPEWSRRAVTGEAIKPRQLWRGRDGGVLPVFFDSEPRLGQGRGRRAVSHVHQWLRSGSERLALLTNGRHWRLIFTGLDFDAWCEWDVDLWFEQGSLSPQVTALRTLLSPALWIPPSKTETPVLLQAIIDSRKGQAELSAVLGERVRKAVEVLLLAHCEALKSRCPDVAPPELYRAAVRIVMRVVVALFAESRDLLPRDNSLYHGAYGAGGLLEELEKTAARGGSRLARSWSAWPRLLALFRLIYSGSHHEALSVPAYGGELFAPGIVDPADGLSRAIAVFESACFEREVMSDLQVYELLCLLTRTRVKVRQGRAGTWIVSPVDFSDLSSEYIGILYEGLLDFELKTAPAGDPIIFLSVGDEPALPISRLEAMNDQALAGLLEKMKNKGKDEDDGDASEDEASSDEKNGGDELDQKEAGDEEGPGAEPELETTEPESDDPADSRRTLRTRAEAWARQAVTVGKLVPKPRGSLTPEKRLAHEQAVSRMAARLVARVVLPGELYLVRWGGTRKGAGTFYTRPGLAVPTVHRTLRPLAYDPPLDSDGKPDQEDKPSSWTPKKPEDILSLKVCDPACGSGTFPVAALRFLTEAVYESLHFHKRLEGDAGRPFDEILGLAAPGGLAESIGAIRLPCRPGDDEFERKTKAILRRYVVERSIYGVDLDPLAVELCRLSLWIETMDRSLPFSFLDHKIKCGNSLVGAWFDQFPHYPVMAWKNREGGDKRHTNGVHFAKESRTRAIKAFVKERLTPDLGRFLSDYALFPEGFLDKAEDAHREAREVLAGLHEIPVHDAAERGKVYREKFLGSEAYRMLKSAMDLWCACWFWPADELKCAPLPTTFSALSGETLVVAERIAREKRFFHWELEYPDVFREEGSGFDAMLGNPPWETMQPNSKEYFSNHDPLYRSYGKQEALKFQTQYFGNPMIEKDWLDYLNQFSDYTIWMKYVAAPFGDPEKAGDNFERFSVSRGNENVKLHRRWREIRIKSRGFSERQHSYIHQGEGKAYTYKLFLEQAYALIRTAGRIGIIVPSGVYSDHGTGGLRRLFLDSCKWEWLFGFENRDAIFDIHRSYKFNPIIVEKGGTTSSIRTAFMRRKLEDWERGEEIATSYGRAQVERFSPRSFAILEIQSRRDLEILEKIYANSVLLGDESPDGWGIKYSQGDFNMTSDSKLFPPRPWWEERGYLPDEYSRWLKGNWRPIGELWAELGIDPAKVQPAEIELEDWLFDTSATPEERQERAQFVHGHLLKPGDVQRTNWRLRCAQPPYDSLPIPRADIPPGIILSREADAWIREDKIEDTAQPLYQGVMIWHFDFSAAQHVHGSGTRAKWISTENYPKLIHPQYLISAKEMGRSQKVTLGPKLAYRRIAPSTNTRTVVATLLIDYPAGDSIFYYVPVDKSLKTTLYATGLFASLVYDYQIRARLAGTNLSEFIMSESAFPKRAAFDSLESFLLPILAGLCLPAVLWASSWTQLSKLNRNVAWKAQWILTCSERIRLRAELDAVLRAMMGLACADYEYILRDTSFPVSELRKTEKKRAFDAKGFWRIDKEMDPELRQTVLTLIASRDLEGNLGASENNTFKGIEAFMLQNNDDGWMIPEFVRLFDYGLGQGDRAKQSQTVAKCLGPRFYDWQLSQSPEESWRECRCHTRNLLGGGSTGVSIEKNMVNARQNDVQFHKIPKLTQIQGKLFK